MISLTKNHREKITLLVFFISFLILFFGTTAFAAAEKYVPLVGIPGITSLGASTSLTDYINALYKFTIALGALLGVLRIAMAGVKYSLTEIVTHKGEAISDIQGVLLGMGILLIPFIVLNTIYPNLTNLEVFKNAPPVDLKSVTRDMRAEYFEGVEPVTGTTVCKQMKGTSTCDEFVKKCIKDSGISSRKEYQTYYLFSCSPNQPGSTNTEGSGSPGATAAPSAPNTENTNGQPVGTTPAATGGVSEATCRSHGGMVVDGTCNRYYINGMNSQDCTQIGGSWASTYPPGTCNNIPTTGG